MAVTQLEQCHQGQGRLGLAVLIPRKCIDPAAEYFGSLGGRGLFGKPEAFKKRRMGVAVTNGDDITQARQRAELAANRVKPVKS